MIRFLVLPLILVIACGQAFAETRYRNYANQMLLNLPVVLDTCRAEGGDQPFQLPVTKLRGKLHSADQHSFRHASWQEITAAGNKFKTKKNTQSFSVLFSPVLEVGVQGRMHVLVLNELEKPSFYLPRCNSGASGASAGPDTYPTMIATLESHQKAASFKTFLGTMTHHMLSRQSVSMPGAIGDDASTQRRKKVRKGEEQGEGDGSVASQATRPTYLALLKQVFGRGHLTFLDYWPEPLVIGLEGDVNLPAPERLSLFFPGSVRRFEKWANDPGVVTDGKQMSGEWLRVRLPDMLSDMDLAAHFRFPDRNCGGQVRRLAGPHPTYEVSCRGNLPINLRIGALLPIQVEDWTLLLRGEDLKARIQVELVGDWAGRQANRMLTTNLTRIAEKRERIAMLDNVAGCSTIIAPDLHDLVMRPLALKLAPPCRIVKSCRADQADGEMCITSGDGAATPKEIILRLPVRGGARK